MARFPILATAKEWPDPNGQKTDSDPFWVNREKNKEIYTPFFNWLHNHPNLFPIIRQLLGLQ
jgi:hypothetical protein